MNLRNQYCTPINDYELYYGIAILCITLFRNSKIKSTITRLSPIQCVTINRSIVGFFFRKFRIGSKAVVHIRSRICYYFLTRNVSIFIFIFVEMALVMFIFIEIFVVYTFDKSENHSLYLLRFLCDAGFQNFRCQFLNY